jgi:hypothetical protein
VAVIPEHGGVKRGTLASILRQAGLTPAEFLELLDLRHITYLIPASAETRVADMVGCRVVRMELAADLIMNDPC